MIQKQCIAFFINCSREDGRKTGRHSAICERDTVNSRNDRCTEHAFSAEMMKRIRRDRSMARGTHFLCSGAVGLLLLLTNVAMTSSQRQSRCPRSCICRDVDPPPATGINGTGTTTVFVGMLIVDCRGRSIAKLPELMAELPVNVGELDLGENEAAVSGSIVRSWFPSLARLRRLRLDHCSLRRLEAQAFRNIRFAIELIDLSHNAID
jgi:hypothetical protein